MVSATPKRRHIRPGFVITCIVVVLVTLFILFVFGGEPSSRPQTPANASMQTARQIGQCLFSYSSDNTQNNNAYPDGNSSTEVFQKLIDEGYVTDSTVFYLPLPGKIKPLPGQKLKPENVCFDLTSGVDSNSPSGLPLVFMTGYKVTYAPGAAAVRLTKPYPQYYLKPRTWSQWWNNEHPDLAQFGIAVMYKGNEAKFMKLGTTVNPDGSIPNFIPPDFKPDGRTYRQLTPDGLLP